MKAVAALFGLACAVLVSYSDAIPAPNCCGLGSPCGTYYSGECCSGLACGPALTCIAGTLPFPYYGYQYPYYGF